jgi:Ca-activated chloride channel family protein
VRHRRAGAAALSLCLVLVGLGGCFGTNPRPTVLRVLASSELADMQPILDELRTETGIELAMDYRGTVDAANALTPGRYQHDLAWLSSDRYFQLKLADAGYTGPKPLATSIMLSPVAVGVKPAVAQLLRETAPDHQISWADVADSAASGALHFAMADPHTSGSGLAALVGVATAAAGTGGVLRIEDVRCDRLRGFFAGHTLSAPTSHDLIDQFVARQGDVDAIITYESVLLSLNASGRLRAPLDVVYPRDGIVEADYPILLLDPAKRAAYDTVVAWLKTPAVQKKIMEATLRRPLEPSIVRDPRLRASVGNALYFPDRQDVVDKLLADYADPSLRTPDRVIFALDYSGSMRGDRIAALRDTFAGLSGADRSRDGRFYRFYSGEQFTVIRFGGRVLDQQDFTVSGPADLTALQAYLARDSFDDSTAIWSTLDDAYRAASAFTRENPAQRVSIVLMTDGENNAGISLGDFLAGAANRPENVPTFTVAYGEADGVELDRVAKATGGTLVDANTMSLLGAFEEIRGC